MASHTPVRTIDTDALLAARPFTGLQTLVVAICAMAAFVDGADRQSIGLVGVNLMRAFDIRATELGVVFSLDNLGAVAGAVVCGQLSDRYGRKPVMVVTLAVMAAATLLTAHAGSYPVLAAARFVAGLGLGGAVPAFLTLAGEYVSRPRRGMVAAIIFAGYPVGAACGGLWTSYLLRQFDWPSIFYVGAILPTLVLIATIVLLPESMQFLARMPGRQEQAARVARRLSPSLTNEAFRLVGTTGQTREPAGSLRALFSNGLAVPTACLWGVYMFLFATVKVVVIWLPSILTAGGIPQASVALILGAWNVGSVCGQLTAFKLMERAGARSTLVAALALVAAGLGLIGEFPASFAAVLVTIVFAGYGVGVATSGVIAITATLYPTEQRGTGLGAGMASSRFGQVLSPLLIALLIDMAVGTDVILFTVAALPLVAAVLTVMFLFAQGRREGGTLAASPAEI